MKVGATWWRGSEAGGPKEGADLAGWRNYRKTSMSEKSEQGMWRELVSVHWAVGGSGKEVLDSPEQRSDMVSLCYIDPCGYNVGCGLKWERVEAGRPL